MLKRNLLHLPFHTDALVSSLTDLLCRLTSCTQLVKKAVDGIRRVGLMHDANRGNARFVLLLLDKHATKVALILQMASGEVDFLGS